MFKRKPKLSTTEIAELLNVPSVKVERWVRQGKIPCKIKGEKFLFDKQEVLQWAEEHDLSFPDPEEPEDKKSAPPPIRLSEAIRRGGIYYDLPGKDARTLLTHAVSRLEFPEEKDKSKILAEILDREAIASTGIGQGVALPHLRDVQYLHMDHPIITVFFTENPVDYNSLDGAPVYVLFMLFCPNPDAHLKILSRLSLCLHKHEFQELLHQRAPRETLMNKIEEIESAIEKKQ